MQNFGGTNKEYYDIFDIALPYTLFQNGRHFSILFLLLNLTLNAAKRANLQSNKRLLKWWPFWNKVYEAKD